MKSSQSNGVKNRIMIVQRRKSGDDEGDGKNKDQRLRRNLDHSTCNDCVEKRHFSGNSECSNQINIKYDAEAFRNMKQENLPTSPLVEETKKCW